MSYLPVRGGCGVGDTPKRLGSELGNPPSCGGSFLSEMVLETQCCSSHVGGTWEPLPGPASAGQRRELPGCPEIREHLRVWACARTAVGVGVLCRRNERWRCRTAAMAGPGVQSP